MEQPITKEQVQKMINEAMQTRSNQNQYAVPNTSFHVHNGLDSPRISITDLDTVHLPTSSTGLSSGSLWNSSGTVKIVS